MTVRYAANDENVFNQAQRNEVHQVHLPYFETAKRLRYGHKSGVANKLLPLYCLRDGIPHPWNVIEERHRLLIGQSGPGDANDLLESDGLLPVFALALRMVH